MNACQLNHGRQTLELRPWDRAGVATQAPGDDPEWTWQLLPTHDAEEARRIVGSLARQGDAVGKLRDLVASDGSLMPSMLDDTQLLDAVAALLSERRWALFERVLTAEARKRYGRPRSVMTPAQSEVVSPSRLRQNQEEPAPAPAPVSDDPAPFDHDAQAATLVLAAANGVPFCEVCERARQARAAANAGNDVNARAA